MKVNLKFLQNILTFLSNALPGNYNNRYLNKYLKFNKWSALQIVASASYAILFIVAVNILSSIWRYINYSPDNLLHSSVLNTKYRQEPVVFDSAGWQLISQQNWFGKYQVVIKPENTAAPAVEETRLKVVLRGIAFGARPGAVIEESAKQQVFFHGDTLTSHDAVIEGIYRDHVLLRYRGKTERLSLEENEGVSPPSSVEIKRDPKLAGKMENISERTSAVSQSVSVPFAIREELVKDPQKIFNYFQLLPVSKARGGGYEIKPGTNRTLFDASGLKEGDIIVSMNERDFTHPREMMAFIRHLPSMPYLQLTVLRKGERYDISVVLR